VLLPLSPYTLLGREEGREEGGREGRKGGGTIKGSSFYIVLVEALVCVLSTSSIHA